jgi:N-acetylglutamate synthase-like GNAT family acetyltransferase
MRDKQPTNRLARSRDLKYILSLARKFSNAVGFLPAAAIEKRIELDQVAIALENSEPCGYLLHADKLAGAGHILPIYQAAVQMDAQRRGRGLELIDQLAAGALSKRQSMLQCWCRQTLDANEFWKAAGFVAVALRDVNAARQSPCILWRKPLVQMTAATLIETTPNTRNHSGGGRSVHKHAWDQLPCITPYATADIETAVARLNNAA